MNNLAVKALKAVTGRGLIVLGGFLVSSLAAQVLPEDQAGWFFLLFNMATFASIVGRFGLETTALRLLSEDVAEKNYQRLSKSFFKIKMLLIAQSTAVALLVATILFLMPYNLAFDSIVWVSAYALLLSFQYFYSEALRSLSMLIASGLFGGALVNLSSVFLLYFWLGDTQDFTIFFSILVTLSVANIAVCEWYTTVVVRGRGGTIVESGRGDLTVKKIYDVASPLGVRSVLAFVLTNSDLWIISLFLEPSSVAIYGAVSRLAFLINFGLQLVNVLVAPKVARVNFKGNLEVLEKVVRQSATVAAVPTLLLFAGLIVFGEGILELFFGSFYVAGYSVMLIVLAGRFFNAISGPCGYTLMMTGHHRFVTKSILCVSVATVSIGYFVAMHARTLESIAAVYAIGGAVQILSLIVKVKSEFGFYTFAHPKYLTLT